MPCLTVKQLGKKGRLANQMLQYAHLRQRAGDNYQCPRWQGQKIFGFNDPLPTRNAIDIGYRFPQHSSWYNPVLFRNLYQFKREPMFENQTVIGVHFRRGDYGTFRRKSARWCFRAPESWYMNCICMQLHKLINPIVYFCSDEKETIDRSFAGSLHLVWFETASAVDDLYALTQCDYLLISNSTFSFVASMLSTRVKECWRPLLSKQALISYEPWDSDIVLKNERYG